MYCTGGTECPSHTPGSHSVCAVRTPLGVDRKFFSVRKEPMLSGFFLTLNKTERNGNHQMWFFYLNRQWACANSCAVMGWSECFRILGYSEKGRWCGFYVPLIILAASQNGHSISRSWYTLQEGMVLVADVLILVLSWDGQSISGVMPMCCTTHTLS